MADRHDDFERGWQGRRGDWQDRAGQDRGDFGREDWDRNRSRGNWGSEHERSGRGDWGGDQQRYGRGQWAGNEQYGRGQWSNYDQERYGGRGDEFRGGQPAMGGREEREYQPHGSAWQRNNSSWFQRRQEEGPFGAGPQGYSQGYRSGEGGMGGYTGFGGGGAESYYGGAGSSGQYRGSGSNRDFGDYGSQGRMGTYGNQSSGQNMGAGSYGYQGGAESQFGGQQRNWGQQQHGRFSGRGPKGYQRSDDRIKEDVCERLTHHGDLDASEIEVQVRSGEVTLTGTVDERNGKRMAEEIAENVSGVKDVHNQIHVSQHSGMNQHTGSTQQGSTSSQTSGSNQQSGSKELTGSQRK